MNRHLLSVIAIVGLLAGCGTSQPPMPPAQPIPPATPTRPGVPVVTLDVTASIDPTAVCTGSPFECTGPPNAKWGLIPATTSAAFTPGPVMSFATDPLAGMALISTTTFERTRPSSVEGTFRVDSMNCSNSVSFVGVVDYGSGKDDGDRLGNYYAWYISCFPGDIIPKLWLYTPPFAGVVPGSPIIGIGMTHTLREDWYPGDHVDLFMDNQKIFTVDAAFAAAHGISLAAPANQHPATWYGSVTGALLQFNGWGTAAAVQYPNFVPPDPLPGQGSP